MYPVDPVRKTILTRAYDHQQLPDVPRTAKNHLLDAGWTGRKALDIMTF